MAIKELKIDIPDGYEIDRENSTLERIVFKKKGEIRYDDVVRELFKVGDIAYYINCSFGVSVCPTGILGEHHCKTRLQAEKLDAINKLMNVAKYLNGDWTPNWEDDEEEKWSIFINGGNNIVGVLNDDGVDCSVYFKTLELAERAIDILGEKIIRTAFSTDW